MQTETNYHIISDIHGDCIMFIRFLISVYNKITNKHLVLTSKLSSNYIPNRFIFTTNLPKSQSSFSFNEIVFDINKIITINNGIIELTYERFIDILIVALKDNHIILNGDIFDSHIPNAINKLSLFNVNGNNIKMIDDENKKQTITSNCLSKIIEIIIIYQTIKRLMDNNLLTFIIGNHEWNLFTDDKIGAPRNEKVKYKNVLFSKNYVDIALNLIKHNMIRSVNLANLKINNLIVLLRDIVFEGYFEKTFDKFFISHAPNKINVNRYGEIKLKELINKEFDLDLFILKTIIVNRKESFDDRVVRVFGHITVNYYVHNSNYYIDKQISVYEIIKNIVSVINNKRNEMIEKFKEKGKEYKTEMISDIDVINNLKRYIGELIHFHQQIIIKQNGNVLKTSSEKINCILNDEIEIINTDNDKSVIYTAQLFNVMYRLNDEFVFRNNNPMYLFIGKEKEFVKY